MVRTIEKLQKRARELDRKVARTLSLTDYDQQAADDRDLLEEAVKTLQTSLVMVALAESVLLEKRTPAWTL